MGDYLKQTHTDVLWRQRVSWTWKHVGLDELFWSLAGAVIVGLLTVIVSPAEAGLTLFATGAAITTAVIVFAAQFVAKVIRARGDILALRLKHANERIDEFEEHQTEKLDLIYQISALAQDLLAAPVSSKEDLDFWYLSLKAFNELLTRVVGPALETHEWLQVRHADPEDVSLERERAYDDKHFTERRKLKARLNALQNIVQNNLA